MPRLTKEERVFIVKKYFETKSYMRAQAAFQYRFQKHNQLIKTVQSNVKKCSVKCSRGTGLNRYKEFSGRRRTLYRKYMLVSKKIEGIMNKFVKC